MAYLLDTDWAINLLKGQVDTKRTLLRLRGARVAVSIVTVAELYDEAFNSPNPQGRLMEIRHFLSVYVRLPIDDGVAESFAETRTFLRRRGELINDFDLIIAATALSHNLTLLTFNRRHFERIPDLKLYQAGA